MNNKVIITHPILGDITLNDILQDLTIIFENSKIIEELLPKSFNNEDLEDVLGPSISSQLEWIISVLENSQ